MVINGIVMVCDGMISRIMILHHLFFFNDNDPLPFCSARSWVQHFVGAYLEPK